MMLHIQILKYSCLRSLIQESKTADVEPNTNSFGKLLQEGSNPTLDNARRLGFISGSI